MMDDLLDNSLVREKQPSWHSLPDIGLKAAFHGGFIEKSMYYLLQKYFSFHPQYTNMLHLMSATHRHVVYSHCLDTLPYCETNMTQELMETNQVVSKYGSIYPCVMLPLYLANIQNQELIEKMKKILIKMGQLFQIEVSNCYRHNSK